jgi:transposase
VVERKVRNELGLIRSVLAPYKEELEVVVETTFNWYWLVDGLQDEGYRVHLAHALGVRMITGAKVKTDRRDAFTLAKLLRAGLIPQAYIYPRAHRPIRDLERRRLGLVRLRAREYGSLRRLLLREGILEHSRNGIKKTMEEDLERWFADRRVQLCGKQSLERIRMYTGQILDLERVIAAGADRLPGYEELMTIPGVSKTLAATILYEVGDIHRFRDVRHFSSYCRVVPGVAESCQVTRRGRGSKQGNPHLKWAFSQAAVYAVRFSPVVRRHHDKHVRRHKGRARKVIAYSIIAHRLAQAAYHILRDGATYRQELLFS